MILIIVIVVMALWAVWKMMVFGHSLRRPRLFKKIFCVMVTLIYLVFFIASVNCVLDPKNNAIHWTMPLILIISYVVIINEIKK